MKAVVQIELSSNREMVRTGKPPVLGVKAVWVEGTDPVGDLTVGQVLAMLKQAEGFLLSNVPFDPPDRQIEVVPSGTLKQLDKLAN